MDLQDFERTATVDFEAAGFVGFTSPEVLRGWGLPLYAKQIHESTS